MVPPGITRRIQKGPVLLWAGKAFYRDLVQAHGRDAPLRLSNPPPCLAPQSIGHPYHPEEHQTPQISCSLVPKTGRDLNSTYQSDFLTHMERDMWTSGSQNSQRQEGGRSVTVTAQTPGAHRGEESSEQQEVRKRGLSNDSNLRCSKRKVVTASRCTWATERLLVGLCRAVRGGPGLVQDGVRWAAQPVNDAAEGATMPAL